MYTYMSSSFTHLYVSSTPFFSRIKGSSNIINLSKYKLPFQIQPSYSPGKKKKRPSLTKRYVCCECAIGRIKLIGPFNHTICGTSNFDLGEKLKSRMSGHRQYGLNVPTTMKMCATCICVQYDHNRNKINRDSSKS